MDNEISSDDLNEDKITKIKNISYEYINNYLNNLEKELNITILYACETGSRAVGVDVEESDFDIKGFYIANENEYLTVIRNVNPILNIHHLTLKIESFEYDLDIEFRDIKQYFYDKITNNYVRSDLWFKSKVIYRNNIEEFDFEHLQKYLNYDIFIFSPYDKSGIDTLKKNLQKTGKITNKKLLNLMISIFQFLHTQLFNGEFPFYNIFDEINFIKDKLNNDNYTLYNLNEEEKNLIEKSCNLVEGLYIRKKQGRKSTTSCIPELILEFYNFVAGKYKPEILRKEIVKQKSNFNEEFAEEFFEKYLNKYNK
jgi:predicted nucleotidyltransferase